MPTDSPGIPSAFISVFIIVVAIAVAGVIVRAVLVGRRAEVLRKGGLDPLIAKEQLEAQLARHLRSSATPASGQPARTIEERLTELDDLHDRGVITAEERAAGRAKIIGDA